MAKRFFLDAEIREQIGSKSAEKLRKQGRIPAIVYGHKKEAKAISVNSHDFVEGLYHGHRVMDIGIGQDKGTVLVKELQYDRLGKDVIHADLLLVDVTERIKLSVPLEFKGEPKGASEGGIIKTQTDSLEVECLVTNIPESLLVSIKEMDVGDALYAKDIELPSGVTLVSAAEALVVTCSVVAEEVVEEVVVEEEKPVTPEVIGEAGEEPKPSEKEEQKQKEGEKK